MSVKVNKVIEMTKKMNKDQFEVFMSVIDKKSFTQNDLVKLERNFATRNLDVSTKSLKEGNLAKEIYSNELYKIKHILNDQKLVRDLNGLKVLFYGDTGTGKTTFINEVAKSNKDFILEDLKIEQLISSKMGQTQLNLMTLSEELNLKYENDKAILFIDEIDSLVSSRIKNENDIGEHSRVISTFIKFLDSLNMNIVLFAATNIPTTIDDAIMRRFNIKMEGIYFNFDKFIDYTNLEYEFEENDIPLSKRVLEKIKSQNSEIKFKLSDISDFIKNNKIEKSIKGNVDLNSEFLIFFKDRLKIDFEKVSDRMLERLKKIKWEQ